MGAAQEAIEADGDGHVDGARGVLAVRVVVCEREVAASNLSVTVILLITRPGFTVVSNRCLTNKAMLVLVDELNLL